MYNDDRLYLSKFELDPEYNDYMDPTDDMDFYFGNDDDQNENDGDFDDFTDDIWEA